MSLVRGLGVNLTKIPNELYETHSLDGVLDAVQLLVLDDPGLCNAVGCAYNLSCESGHGSAFRDSIPYVAVLWFLRSKGCVFTGLR